MALDARFYKAVDPLYFSGMGTENVAPLLYSLIRTTRPQSILEVGLGYTTPFMAQGLKDNVEEFESDREVLRNPGGDEERRLVLKSAHYETEYVPRLHGIDDFSLDGSSAPAVLDVVNTLGLESFVQVDKADFRGHSRRMDQTIFPLDFVWFDCGGLDEYIDFIEEYWGLINPHHGLLVLHFTYWTLRQMGRDGVRDVEIISGPVANEMKRQQMTAGVDANFEVLSLLEPHKRRQGSATLIRKLPWSSKCRDRNFQQEVSEVFGAMCKPMIKL